MNKLEELIERAHNLRETNLNDFIESENLDEIELGRIDILYADNLNNILVPCEEYLIFAREYVDADTHQISAEYAIYTQHDKDGHTLRNSLNMNAVYRFDYLGDEIFTNMASAIAYATNLIYQLHQNEDITEGDE